MKCAFILDVSRLKRSVCTLLVVLYDDVDFMTCFK